MRPAPCTSACQDAPLDESTGLAARGAVAPWGVGAVDFPRGLRAPLTVETSGV